MPSARGLYTIEQSPLMVCVSRLTRADVALAARPDPVLAPQDLAERATDRGLLRFAIRPAVTLRRDVCVRPQAIPPEPAAAAEAIQHL